MAPSRAGVVRYASTRSCLVSLSTVLHTALLQTGKPMQSIVVELSWSSQKGKEREGETKGRAFVGWTGLPASTTTAQQLQQQNILEIDAQFAREINLREGQSVAIQFHVNLPTARAVNVSPLSVDDWEVLESHADFVESTLLNQVRAAKTGQPLCVWVGKGRSLIRFTVDSIEPDDEDEAVRLSNDTEVRVAPKTRQSAAAASAKHDVLAGPSTSNSTLVQQASTQLYRVLPEPLDASSPTARVSKTAFSVLSAAFPSTRCAVSLRPRPKRRAEASEDGAADRGTEKKEPRLVEGVYFELDPSIPPHHVALSSEVFAGLELPTQLGQDGSGGYPLVRFTASKAAQTNGTSEHVKSPSEQPKPCVPPAQPAHACRLPVTPDEPEQAPRTLAGVQKQIDSCLEFMTTALETRRAGQRPACLLLYGAAGSGKTSVAQAVARLAALDPEIRTHVAFVDCAKHQDERAPVLKANVRDWLDEAAWHAPSLLVLDNLDRMVPAEVEHIDPFRTQQIAHLFMHAIDHAIADCPVLIIATAEGPTSVNSLLSSSHLFTERVKLSSPDKTARRDILAALVSAKTTSSSLRPADQLDYMAVATQTDGYLPADLNDLVDRAVHQTAIRTPIGDALELQPEDFATAQADFVPLSLKDVKLQKSETAWADIGGLHETRRVLRETLEWPTKYGAIFAKSPLRLRSGLLLYGYPGCGKTLLASAVAKECGLNFISVKGPELLNKYIGASEKSVRDLFDRAQSAKPCVLFFDEFDSIAPKRGHDSTGVTDRVVNQLLTQMDGAEGLEGVYVLAATSRPDLIDPALLRPGRLDKSLLCDMPSRQDRLEIMQASARKISLADGVDLDELAASTAGYSGADLQALVYNAHLDAVHTSLAVDQPNGRIEEEETIDYVTFGGPAGDAKAVLSRAEQAQITKRLQIMLGSTRERSTVSTASVDAPKRKVEQQHLRKSLSSTRPSVPKEEVARLRRIYDEFVSARSSNGGLPTGEPSDEIGGRSSLM